MLSLSQIIFGVNDLDAATHRFRAMGFDVLDGGVHPGVGTANRIIPLGAQYIELLGVVAPDLARESEYGRSLLRCDCGRRSAGALVAAHGRDRRSSCAVGITVEPRKRRDRMACC